MSEGIYNNIEYCSVLHDGDTLSDHDVVSLHMAIDIKHYTVDVEQVSKLLWSKATDSQLNQYNHNLNHILSRVKISNDVVNCRDKFCSVHRSDIQEYHDEIVSACIQASSCIPMSNPSKRRKVVPGWNDFVNEYKNKAIFWHKLWKENGSPHTGILHDIRRKTRWEYHHMLKIVKRNQEVISAHKMSEGLAGTGFWSEVKRIIGNKYSVCNTIDSIQGGANIANLFKDKYNQLYNSVSFDTQQMAALMSEID